MDTPDRTSEYTALSRSARDTLTKLPDQALEKLDGDGSQNSEFGSCAASFALSWIGAGGTLDTFLEVVEASHLGQTYPRPSRISRVLTRSYEWAEEHFDPSHATGDVRQRLEQLRQRLELSSLHPGIRTSALAVVKRGIEINTWTVDVSTRQLSEWAGCSIGTASAHIHRLRDLGVVSRIEARGKGNSRRLHLDLDYHPPTAEVINQTDQELNTYVLPVDICSGSDHFELWSAHGVGQTAYRIYSCLGVVPATVADLIRATGAARNTVTKHLSTLVDLGLAVEIPGKRKRYCINLLPDLDHALAMTGAAEKLRAKQDRHTQDRRVRAAYLEDHPEQAGRSFDPPVRSRWLIESVLTTNPWTTEIFDADQRRFRFNHAGLEYLRSLDWDDQLTINLQNPPEEFKEYRDDPPEKRSQRSPDPFVRVFDPDEEPPF